jgi:dihydroflavonol-4-reductase
MLALVTGATGFLGSNLTRLLAEQGHQVRVLVRRTSDRSRLAGLSLEVVEGDVTDELSVTRALAGVDVVFHTAALVELGARDRLRMWEVNVGGTRTVVGAAAERGIRAVHVSSVAALGATGPEPVDEQWWSPDPPKVAYEATKREAHRFVRRLGEAGAPVRIGTPGGIYGYGDESDMATLITTFVRYPTPIGYLPELMQSLVNVDDCADALVRIAERGHDGGEYLISADVVTFRRWFELIAAGAGRRPPSVYVPTRAVRRVGAMAGSLARWKPGHLDLVVETVAIATRHQAFSGRRLRDELGWQPRSLGEGMAEMAAAIRAGSPDVSPPPRRP